MFVCIFASSPSGEMADTPSSGGGARKSMGVQVSPWAQKIEHP